MTLLDLRPVEEFRHTPLIPISERDLALNKRKIEEANRKGYYVEIKKDTLYFYSKNCFNQIFMQIYITLIFSDCLTIFGNYWLCIFNDE